MLGGLFCSVLPSLSSLLMPLSSSPSTTHTSDQSERSHSLGQSSFLQACWEASFEAEQKVSGSSRKLPSAMRCLQSTSRLWMPPPQVLEHWAGKENQPNIREWCVGVPSFALALVE